MDKNEKGIYEGDVISHEDVGIVGVVCWSAGTHGYFIEKGEEMVGHLSDYDYQPEVIGNTFDNPDLLK